MSTPLPDPQTYANAVADSVVADQLASSIGEVSNLVAIELIDCGYCDVVSATELDAITDSAAARALGTPCDPSALAPQGIDQDDAAQRRAVKLTLVIENDGAPARRYHTDADAAWTHRNNAYDHVASSYETPSDASSCYYTHRKD